MARTCILAGDIGATTTRLALFDSRSVPGQCVFEVHYANSNYADFAAVLARFLADCGARTDGRSMHRACLGVAGAVSGTGVRLTNLAWSIDANVVSAHLRGAPVRLLNDFEAAAHGIDALALEDRVTLQIGQARTAGPQVLIGAGSGLGVAYRLWNGERYQVAAGEGGHAGFAPSDAGQCALLIALLAKHGRVSAEHVVSGPGLLRIHEFLRHGSSDAQCAPARDPAEVSRRAMSNDDPIAARALDMFIACYGAVAGDHALAIRAQGGVYVAGGIAAKILPRLAAGGFVAAFNAKGPHAGLARSFPVHVVATQRLGLLGAAQVAIRDSR